MVAKKLADNEKLGKKLAEQLENISGISADDAKTQLVAALKDEAKTNAMAYIKDIQEEAKINANKEAKKLLFKRYSGWLPNMRLKIRFLFLILGAMK